MTPGKLYKFIDKEESDVQGVIECIQRHTDMPSLYYVKILMSGSTNLTPGMICLWPCYTTECAFNFYEL